MSALGACMRSREACSNLCRVLTADDFFAERNAAIFRAVKRVWDRGFHPDGAAGVDFVLLAAELEQFQELELAGGTDYLLQCYELCPAASNFAYYAALIRVKAKFRLAIERGGKIAESVLDTLSMDEIADKIGQEAAAIQEEMRTLLDTPRTGKLAIRERMDVIEDAYNTGEAPKGVETGIAELDTIIGGMQPGELIICAARTSIGKTAIGVNILCNVARFGQPVLYASLEMPEAQIVDRVISHIGKVDGSVLKRLQLPEETFRAVYKASETVYEWPFRILDKSSVTTAEIYSHADALRAAEGKLGLVIVDYLQLLAKRTPGRGNRYEEVGAAAADCKQLARELSCPVIALSQLSRKVEERSDKRPQLSDLRDSGNIEEDADQVWLLWPTGEVTDGWHERGIAVDKNRNGPKGDARIWFFPRYGTFGIRP